MAQYAFWVLVVAAAMTSFYSWRLVFMTFYGEARGDHHTHDHAHESPLTMLIPLGVLALGAVFAGMIWYEPFFGHGVEEFFGHSVYMHHETNSVIHDAHDVPSWVKVSPFIAMVLGFALSYVFYIAKPETPAKLAQSQHGLYQFLLNKWYFDELYDFIFVRPAKALGRFLWKKGDGRVIDGFLNGLAMGIVPYLTRKANQLQSGYLFHYAFAMFIGLALLVTWFAISGGSH
jgi:NADH-quinone oxidoreductase subunit L